MKLNHTTTTMETYMATYELEPEGRTEGLLETGFLSSGSEAELEKKLCELNTEHRINFGFIDIFTQDKPLSYFYGSEKKLIFDKNCTEWRCELRDWLSVRHHHLYGVREERKKITAIKFLRRPSLRKFICVVFKKRIFIFRFLISAEVVLSSLVERDELENTELLVLFPRGCFRALVEYEGSSDRPSVFRNRIFVPFVDREFSILDLGGRDEELELTFFRKERRGE